MTNIKNKLLIDTRLNEEEMNFLWSAISQESKTFYNSELAGNISKSELIQDKDNWFYKTVLKKLTDKMFYREDNNYYKYHVEKEEKKPKFKLNTMWVNYQKKHEFNPLHIHNSGKGFSFVIFVKIPTHWEEQHELPISANSNTRVASNFAFVWTEMDSKICKSVDFSLCPDDEGMMLFFPSWLMHQVYPFYGTEEERITISGNINRVSKEQDSQPIPLVVDEASYESNARVIELMENKIINMKLDLKKMEKNKK